MFRLSRLLSNTTALLLLITVAGSATTAWADPSGRVAYMSDIQGAISYSPAGVDAWVNVERNRPLIQGDRLWSDQNSRAEFQIGSAAYRLGDNTSLEILDLNDHIAQLRLTQGSVNISVRRIYKGQTIEIDTPLLAFTIKRRGLYRIDVDPYDGETTVSVWKGSGRAYGQNSRFNVKAGESVVFYDSSLNDYEVYGVSAYDEFDQYALQRDERYTQSASLQYVNDDLVGYAELDTYGSWSSVNTYGNVWFPTRVSAGWAPYSDGHWVWQEPWGWTWVDNAPWGFAPSHYGRWVSVQNRWGWVPGPRQVRPIYAPALVAFVGGSGWSLSVSVGGVAPIGWFPIGPREVYVPSYRVSQDYFTRVNVNNTVVNNTTINNVYNNYSSGDINVNQVNYANRNVESAITAVPSNVFVNAQSTEMARLRVDRKALSTGEVTRIAPLAPDQNSVLGAGKAVKNENQPKRDVFDRQVVAHNAPPPPPVAFSKREKQLQKQPGRALEPEVVAVMADDNKKAQRKVHVVSDQAESVDARAKSKGRPVKEDTSGKPQKLDRSTADRKAKNPAKVDGAEAVTPKQDRSGEQAAEQQQQKANADKKADSDKRAAQQQQKADADQKAARQQQQKAGSDKRAAEQQQQKANADKKADSDKRAAQQQQKADADQKAARQQQQKADSDKRAAEQQQQKADSDQKAARQQQQKANADKKADSDKRAAQQQQKADSDQKAARQQQQKADADRQAAEQQQHKANADKKADSDKRAAQQQQKADSDQKAARQQQQKADADRQAAEQQQHKANADRKAAQQQQKAANQTPAVKQPSPPGGQPRTDRPATSKQGKQHGNPADASSSARQPPNTQNQPAADTGAGDQGQPSDSHGKSTKSKSQAQCEREAKKQNQDPSICQADS